jgi:rhodanese-related sulfurtransferase/rubrerythrin
MENQDITPLTPDELRSYISANPEKDYLLVDVRQPPEYGNAHIPGAMLLPLPELESKLFSLPSDRDLVFYCHVGGRSLAAADLAAGAEVTEKRVFHLDGGIMAWDGKVLPGFPRVQVFDKTAGHDALLTTAMNLEKGAFRFYGYLQDYWPEASFSKTVGELALAEAAHARAIYRFWRQTVPDPPAFEDLFDSLKGNIIEGGEPVADVLDRIQNTGDNPCMVVLETALSIEYAAYDLYRTMAEKVDSAEAKEAFLSISQAEKAHMRKLTAAIPDCPET